MNAFRLIVLFLTITLGCHSNAIEPKSLTVGVEAIHYPPFWSFKHHQYSGFAKELLNLFASKNNYQLSFRPLPVNRLWLEFTSGNIDLKFPDNPSWAATKNITQPIYYSQAVAHYVDGVLVKKKNRQITLDQMSQLGIIRGFFPSNEILYSGVNILEASNMKQLYELILIDRISGIYSNIEVARHLLHHHSQPTEELVFNPSLPHTNSSYFLSSIKYPAIIVEFSNFLTIHKASIDKLKQKYNIPTD